MLSVFYSLVVGACEGGKGHGIQVLDCVRCHAPPESAVESVAHADGVCEEEISTDANCVRNEGKAFDITEADGRK